MATAITISAKKDKEGICAIDNSFSPFDISEKDIPIWKRFIAMSTRQAEEELSKGMHRSTVDVMRDLEEKMKGWRDERDTLV